MRVILTNPRYTGRQVWSKQRKADILIDVNDVALGHETKMRWNPSQDWIYSAAAAHEPSSTLKTSRNFQQRVAAGAKQPDGIPKPRASKRHYPLSGLLFCGLCGRRMEGSFNNEPESTPGANSPPTSHPPGRIAEALTELAQTI